MQCPKCGGKVAISLIGKDGRRFYKCVNSVGDIQRDDPRVKRPAHWRPCGTVIDQDGRDAAGESVSYRTYDDSQQYELWTTKKGHPANEPRSATLVL